MRRTSRGFPLRSRIAVFRVLRGVPFHVAMGSLFMLPLPPWNVVGGSTGL